MVWILGACVDFSGNLCENKDFCPKKPRNPGFYFTSPPPKKKSLEIQPPLLGEGKLFSGIVQ